MRLPVIRLLTEVRFMLACRRGAVAIIFAFSLTLLIISIGMGVDLWRAYIVKARLQSAVDAAALALASTDRTPYSDPQDPFLVGRMKSYVTANYPAAVLGKPGTPILSYASSGATVTDDIIIVSDTATVPTTFMRIIGRESLSVSVTGEAKASWSNIDFYLLLDSSPSMGIAATAAGISTMVAATLHQCDQPPAGASNPTCGCGFACHETKPASDSSCASPWSASVSYAAGNYVFLSSNKTTYTAKTANKNHTPPNTTYWTQVGNVGDNNCPVPGLGNAGGIDNYQLSNNLSVTLRIDDLRKAVSDLMDTAQTTEDTYNLNGAFRMGIYTFDVDLTAIQTIQQFTSLSNTKNVISYANPAASQIQQLLMCYNNVTSINGTCTSNSDADTAFQKAMTRIDNYPTDALAMPPPGGGTKDPKDTPKEVLFLVTDGVGDEQVSSCHSSGGTPNGSASPYVTCSGNRQMSAIDTSLCTAIKNRGISVAVLYLEYGALPTNGWYNTYVSPYNQPPPPTGIPPTTPTPIETTLQNCASVTKNGVLYAKVVQGGDISAALSKLFDQAVNAVYLSK